MFEKKIISMHYLFLYSCVASAFIFCQGCGTGRVPVSGTVAYEDGAPFTQGGRVVFETGEGYDSFMVRAELSSDGKYNTGAQGGLIPGRYRVCLAPAVPDSFDEPIPGSIDENGNQVILDLPNDIPPPRSRTRPQAPRAECDPKFLSFETSGLLVDVQSGVKTFDVVVGKRPEE